MHDGRTSTAVRGTRGDCEPHGLPGFLLLVNVEIVYEVSSVHANENSFSSSKRGSHFSKPCQSANRSCLAIVRSTCGDARASLFRKLHSARQRTIGIRVAMAAEGMLLATDDGP